MMGETYAVIMAGGAGSRFWPASRRSNPKQLLPLGPTEEPLLTATINRLSELIPKERVLIVTNQELTEATRAAAPGVPKGNILAEPVGRNTAPCVGWAAAHIRRRDPEGVMAVLPADHHVGDEGGFIAILRTAIDAANSGHVVTVGIRPTRAETGYGYIELADEITEGVFRARRFVEKPHRTRAQQFIAAGNFLWNSGMFFFRAQIILDAISTHLPGLSEGLAAFDKAARDGREDAEVRDRYPSLPSVSFDHGVMEKTERVAVVPGDFGWSDLGSWTSAWELADKEIHGNVVPNDAILRDAHNNYVQVPQGKLVAVIGVDDLVVVDTGDALLVIPRERAQDVREVVDELKRRDDSRL